VYRALRPIRDEQAPTLGQMFSDGPDQCIDQRLTHRPRNCVDAPLLGRLVGMVQVELVGELIQGSIEFGRRLSRSSRDVGKGLRSVHRRILAQLRANVRGRRCGVSLRKSHCRLISADPARVTFRSEKYHAATMSRSQDRRKGAKDRKFCLIGSWFDSRGDNDGCQLNF